MIGPRQKIGEAPVAAIARVAMGSAALAVPWMAGGCLTASPSGPDTGSAVTELVWPRPPEAPRIAFVQTIDDPADMGERVPGWKRALDFVTGAGREEQIFVTPQGVAVDELGNLCLTDPGAGMVCFFDGERKRFRRWHTIGEERLLSPVAVGRRNGVFFVADSGLGKVLAFDHRGRRLFEIAESLERPAGLAVNGDRLYVADATLHRILVFDLQGRLLHQFGERGAAPGQLNAPTHLAVDGLGHIYVTDALNSRVQVFDQQGAVLAVIGSAGDTSGHFSRPKGVAVDSLGHVYVVDALFDNVQGFDGEGRFLLHWGESGSAPGEFWLPAGIAVDHDDRIYVADAHNRRIQVFQYIGEP